jgi:hypothetical protein
MSTQPTTRPPAPRPCTTAREVRELALEPAMEFAATARREQILLVRIFADTQHPAARELAGLLIADEDRAKAVCDYLDGCASRLDAAEHYRSCWGPDAYIVREVSEDGRATPGRVAGRTIAGEVRAPLKVLMDSSRRPLEHRKARTDLRALLSTYGDAVFEPRVTKHLGNAQVLALKGELNRMKDGA